jgi:hypothetical protein
MVVAIAMNFASIASAWATSLNAAPTLPEQQTAVSHHLAAMPDCEGMGHVSTPEAPGEKHKSCADNFCIAKCFKVFGGIEPRKLAVRATPLPAPVAFRQPAIWRDPPPITPPRS